MTEPEELEEDLFADLYDTDEKQTVQESSKNVQTALESLDAPDNDLKVNPDNVTQGIETVDMAIGDTMVAEPPSNGFHLEQNSYQDEHINGDGGIGPHDEDTNMDAEHQGIGIKEDGKMFIGGLNWETTDQSLRDYFSQFGEVHECTVMRDGASGRSRGFGFLTFKDPKTVNIVMVKEHYLDGKIIDPKRAIPRDEQERTSKIFVGGVSQDATEADFKEYFARYGRVVDATLMMDKDTGRPRGFGFVTFDSEAAVDATLQGDLMILGKPIDVKKAQPRGNIRDEEENRDRDRKGGRRGGRDNDRFRDNDRNNFNDNNGNNGSNNNQGNNQQGTAGMPPGTTPQMMAQYWQRMQQFYALMQQQMAAGSAMMNPAAMQQMQQLQQLQQMKAMQAMQQQQQGSQSPHPQSPGVQGTGGMNPAMLQQMQQMQNQQGGFNPAAMNGNPMGSTPTPQGPGGFGAGPPPVPPGRNGTPGYNAQEQLLFEQRKYEQQQARRAAQEAHHMQYQGGGPTSWEGMYDDVPQPNHGSGGRGGRRGGHRGRDGGNQGNHTPQTPQSAPPANAPTGPKNAGVPGANYRGGGRGGHHRGGFHPYARKG